MRLRAPDVLAGIGEDQHQRIGEEQLVELLALIHVSQQEALHDPAENGDTHGGNGNGAKKAQRRLAQNEGHVPGNVGSDHVERAVRKVDDLEHTKNKGQARCDEEKKHRRGQPRSELA